MKLKIVSASIFFITAIALGAVFVPFSTNPWKVTDFLPHDLSVFSIAQTAVLVSPIIFIVASFAIFSRPELANRLGFMGSLIVLAWSVWEQTHTFVVNPWMALNLPGNGFLSIWMILAVATNVIAFTTSTLRLLPIEWTFRKSPIREQSWPAFALCAVVLAVWFRVGAVPYRVPLIVDGSPPELNILHVEKRGLQFEETKISVQRNSEFFIWRNNRRLFQYKFQERGAHGLLSRAARLHVFAQIKVVQGARIHTPAPVSLHKWNAEGWFVDAGDSGILAFTSEYGTQPPTNIVDLFHEIERMETEIYPGQHESRDVCLGFCYDPLASLGFRYVNSRCRADENANTKCR